jgi:2-dehydropantoate 2-reductase
MRVIIHGAGAVGSVIGGRLAQGGADVVLVARPAHVEAIRANGLTLRMASGAETISVPAVTAIDELTPRPDDIVLITAKTQDTPAIHDALTSWNPAVPVVCATNGVEHERMALRRFANVYGMSVNLPAQFHVPGEVTALWTPNNAVLDVGRYPAGVDDIAAELAGVLDGSPRISSEADPHVMRKKHAKLLVNLGNVADAAAALAGRRAAVVAEAMAEGRRVYAAAGIEWEQPADLADHYEARLREPRIDVPAGDTFVGGSTWQSLMKGAGTIETDYFHGEIVLLARLHGVPAPTNEFLQHYAGRLLRRERQPGEVSLEQLDTDWREWMDAALTGTGGSSS